MQISQLCQLQRADPQGAILSQPFLIIRDVKGNEISQFELHCFIKCLYQYLLNLTSTKLS